MTVTSSLTGPASESARPAPASSTLKAIARGVLRRPLALASLAYLLALSLACALASWIAPFNPLATNFDKVLSGPSGSHLLGTDELGRDVLSRLLYGGRPILLATLEVVVLAVIIGVTVGVVAGFWGGRVDGLLGAWVDVLLALPLIVVLVVVLSIFAGSLTPAVVPLGIILSAPATRVVRSATLSARNELFVDAARVSGLSRRQIITRHILPRVAGPVIVQSTLLAAVALTTIASLAFLGLGVRPPAPTWGSMVAEAAQVYQTQPMYLLVCGGLIALTVLAFGLLGEGIGDSMSERWAASGAPSRPSRRRPQPVAVRDPAETHAAVPEAPSALRVSGLTVSFPWAYDGRNVVEDVSFSVAAGETVALVGESGSGKSVTARALLGLLPGGTEISGSAALNGHELLSLSERELSSVRGSQIALISQDPVLSLDPCYTVGKSLRDVVRLHSPVSRRAADAEAARLLERVHIPDPGVVLGRYPHQLSGGMAQRVAIARALAGKPEVLIADEPTTALDVTVQNRILELLFELQESTGIAIVLITHDWGVVATVADRALTMYAGQIVEAAAAEKVFGQPLHPYTAALLRSSPYFSPVGKRLPVVPGSVPTPDEFPRGCRFSNRCPLAVDECREGPIDLREVAGLHDSRCIRTEALLTLEASQS